jgi:hypothetical protein
MSRETLEQLLVLIRPSLNFKMRKYVLPEERLALTVRRRETTFHILFHMFLPFEAEARLNVI